MGLSDLFGQLITPTNNLGRIGKAISQASGGPWGDALTLLDQQGRQEENDQFERLYKAAQIKSLLNKKDNFQGVSFGEGGYGAFDQNTGSLKILREPSQKRTSLQENVEYLKTLNPNLTPLQLSEIAQRGVGGYQYSPEVLQAKQENAIDLLGRRIAGSLAVKQTASYGDLHGGGRINPHGRSKSNPIPVNSPESLKALPTGTWVSLPNGSVVQRR